LCAWLIWLPTTGPFPQTSQRWAMLLDSSGEMGLRRLPRARNGPACRRATHFYTMGSEVRQAWHLEPARLSLP
jgi:hypothetical protein